jgi:hypothetical protein
MPRTSLHWRINSCQISSANWSLEPHHSALLLQSKLHCSDSWIWSRQSGVRLKSS